MPTTPREVHQTDEAGHRPGGMLAVFAGPIVGLLVWALLNWLAPGLPEDGRRAAGLLAWMATWWLGEVLPLGVTALLPLVALPMLGVLSVREAAAPYADRIVFLFMGGFILALAMERWNLHRRIALVVMLLVGTSPRRLLLGIMLATALLSMWVSNTATALMMIPIALGVTALVESEHEPEAQARAGAGLHTTASSAAGVVEAELTDGHRPSLALRVRGGGFGTAVVLGVAYAASIGGLGTPIGSPPNAVLTSFLDRTYGHSIGFGNWMLAGVPFVLVFIPVAWAYLAFFACRIPAAAGSGDKHGARTHLREQYAQLGPISRGEWGVMACFALTVAGWVLREPVILLLEARGMSGASAFIKSSIDDAAIAIVGGLMCFVWPVSTRRRVYLMDWPTMRKLPWDILLLFGGGLSLAAGVQASGLDKALGAALAGLGDWSPWSVVLVCSTISVFVSEFTSNVAQANVFYPILGGIAESTRIDPMVLLFPCCLSLSCAFMLPMGTPPNAIAFSTGRVSMKRFALTGIGMNLIGIVLVMLVSLLVLPHIPGMALTVTPAPAASAP
ncbi:MAG: SLC13 family permease [Phycisphaerales bacterium]